MRAYEPDIANQIEEEVLETKGVMNGARKEVYGFSSYEEMLNQVAWCFFIVNNVAELQRGYILGGAPAMTPSPGLYQKAINFIEVIKQGSKGC